MHMFLNQSCFFSAPYILQGGFSIVVQIRFNHFKKILKCSLYWVSCQNLQWEWGLSSDIHSSTISFYKGQLKAIKCHTRLFLYEWCPIISSQDWMWSARPVRGFSEMVWPSHSQRSWQMRQSAAGSLRFMWVVIIAFDLRTLSELASLNQHLSSELLSQLYHTVFLKTNMVWVFNSFGENNTFYDPHLCWLFSFSHWRYA